MTCTRAAGQPPDQQRIDRAEGELAAARPAPAGRRTLSSSQLDLGAGEVGVEDQAGLLADAAARARRPSAVADRRGAAALPDDGVGDRPAGRALPEDGRLALVGDADRGDVGGRGAGLGQRLRAPSSSCERQIASGSCSTRPGAGRVCGNSRWALATDAAAAIEDDRPAEVVP